MKEGVHGGLLEIGGRSHQRGVGARSAFDRGVAWLEVHVRGTLVSTADHEINHSYGWEAMAPFGGEFLFPVHGTTLGA